MGLNPLVRNPTGFEDIHSNPTSLIILINYNKQKEKTFPTITF